MSRFRVLGFAVLGFAGLTAGLKTGGSMSAMEWPAFRPAEQAQPDDLRTLKSEGEVVYNRECASCHGGDGNGDGAGPALAGDAALANTDRVIQKILDGAPDKGMEPFGKSLSDRDVAAVATYIRTAWDNTHGLVREADVTRVRKAPKK